MTFPPGRLGDSGAAPSGRRRRSRILSEGCGHLVDQRVLQRPRAATRTRSILRLRRKILDEASSYAEFLGDSSGVLVAGMPMRKKGTPDEPSFVDFDYVKAVADLINQIGATTQTPRRAPGSSPRGRLGVLRPA